MDMFEINRRQFLSVAAAGTVYAANVTMGAETNRKLRLGLIGCGGYGMTNVQAAFKCGGVEVGAICDVDSQHLQNAADRITKLQGTRPVTYKNYQDLLNSEKLDAVIIATPPHWHALQFLAALEKGLDIYCEKPLAYDIREGRAMVDAAIRSKSIVQIGFQRRQSACFQQARNYIQEGKAGRIVQVDVQIHYTAGILDTTPQSPPASLDWDVWCGPAPKLPYCPQIGHVAWRLEKEYGHGHLVDWGIHLIDATRWILGESMPHTIQAAGGNYFLKDKITTPDTLTVQFDFATCPVIWKHRIWGAAEYAPEVENGIFFYGDKETVFVTDNRLITIPRDRKLERKTTQIQTDMGTKQVANFLDCVRTRQQPFCPITDAFQSTTTVQLGAISYETNSLVKWDQKAESITNNHAAAALLKRNYRSPWKHPNGSI